MEQDMLNADDLEPPGRGGTILIGQEGVMLVPPAEGKHAKKTLKLVSIRKDPPPKLPCNPSSLAFRRFFFPDVTTAQWNDWHWQLRHRFRDLNALSRILLLSDNEKEAMRQETGQVPMAVTPYYASLLERDNPEQPLRRTVVPSMAERNICSGESADPLGEEHDSPVPGLVHRYPDRVLFLVTDYCSTYCRYCTRSRILGHAGGSHYSKARWEKAVSYIENTPAVRDVLLSGGDALTLPDDKLEWLLRRLRRIPHVEIIRIGTKAPAVLPQRVTPALTRMLKRYHPLWMSLHFTHPSELTPEVAHACGALADAGIPLGSQTVLLAGINDNVQTMKELMHGLLKIRLRPYYLYQCDPILGSGHFRTGVEKGLEIIQGLRGHTSGYAVPSYVIDAPGGGGKIPMLPEYVVGREGGDLLMRNYEGKIYRYPDPGPVAGSNRGAWRPADRSTG